MIRTDKHIVLYGVQFILYFSNIITKNDGLGIGDYKN